MSTSDDRQATDQGAERKPSSPEQADSLSAGDEAEFSLEQLSRAYAKVIRGQGQPKTGAAERVAHESGETGPDREDSGEAEGQDLVSSEVLDPVELDDRRDDAPCRISETSVLEAILFVGSPPDTPLTARYLASLIRDLSPKEVPELAARLNEQYEAQGAAYRVVQRDMAFQLALAQGLEPVREAFYGEVRAAQLSQQAVEVLAIVAYNQPISRSQVEKLRQRPCGAILAQLAERQLLTIDPQVESNRDRLYITTKRFLKLFGLSEIGDLPQAQEVDNIDDFFG